MASIANVKIAKTEKLKNLNNKLYKIALAHIQGISISKRRYKEWQKE
jgi:hypothetical protein